MRVVVEMLSRWGHYMAGVTWIGLLYYFNFVQTPAFAEMDGGHRNGAIDKIVPRALWWFRFAALFTFLTGVVILFADPKFDNDMAYFKTAPGISIFTGILLGTVMLLNVWGIIWPNQKKVIASAQGVLAGREADPAAAAAARRGACASRTNVMLSIPLLFFMGAASHLAGQRFGGLVENRMAYYLVLLVIVVVAEGIALSAPPVGDAKAKLWIDNHRNTIISGFVVWAVLYGAMELLFDKV
ncbi:MAG TPA: urate hydroxylase PuuD [Acidimicrobiales bacterium]|nr:urate hydroxylase PuuD [Acidimicrobiales bacterium]